MNKFETLAKIWLGATLALSFTEGCTPPAKAPETPTPTPIIEPTGTPTIPPEILAGTPQAQLEATVSALKASGQKDSFVPEGKFTRDLYEKVANATVALLIPKGDGITVRYGTGFIVGKEGNTVYLVTARHVIQGDYIHSPTNPSSIFIMGNKASTFELEELQDIAFDVSETRDIALVRANVVADIASSITPLALQDNYPLQPEQRMLAVGYPDEFWQGKPYASAGYLSFVNNVSASDGWAFGLIDGGSSGSPMVIPDDKGSPVVIGVVSGYIDRVNYHDDKLTVTRATHFYSLEVNALMQKLQGELTLFQERETLR